MNARFIAGTACASDGWAGRRESPQQPLIRGSPISGKHPQSGMRILSGGDPLMLKDEVIAEILTRLREIPYVAMIRIHT
ncbi:MAG: hypothetical protein R2861_13055 [Desulfobacterales bacterium]